MKKPIIGIVGRSRLSESGVSLIATPEQERIAILEHGGIPILILPPQLIEYQKCMEFHPKPSELKRLTKEELDCIEKQLELCDGILLPGGDMMFEYDRKICEYCVEKNKPLLGICMGMQVMCTYQSKNVSLYQIQSNVRHKVLNDTYTHSVQLIPSKLQSLIKKEIIDVNSRHGYAVSDAGTCHISAYSKDRVIEAVEIPDKTFCVGVQWHPELDYHTNISSKRIWEEFMKACNKKKE